MKKSPETLAGIAEFLARDSSITKACKASDIGASTFFQWFAESKRNPSDPELRCTFMGEEMPFADAVTAAKQLYVLTLASQFESEATGHYEQQVHQGQLVYALNPKFIGWTDNDFERFGIDPAERYMRDPAGNAKPLKIFRPGNVAHRVAVLAAHMPDAYAPKRDVTYRNENAAGGVLVVKSGQPQQVAPPQTVERLPAPASLVATDAELAALMGDDEPEEGEFVEVESVEETPAPAVQPQNISPLQRDLLDRLARLRENGPTKPTSIPKLGHPPRADDPPEGGA